MSAPTLRDVAAEAGVHPGTASRALNPEMRHLVNAETARQVQAAAARLAYQPNPMARSLKTTKTRTIGLLVPDLTNPMFPPIVRGIESSLRTVEYSALIANTDNDPGRERTQLSSLRLRNVDGLIVATARLDHPLLRDLHAERVPMVLVNRRTEGLDVPSVTPDDTAGTSLAVGHLAELGHIRIAHLAGPQDSSAGVLRARAFRSAIRDHGLDQDERLVVVCDRWSDKAGASAISQLLASRASFTAVVAGNDLIALGCYDVFTERGIECPAEISVVGFNNMPFLDKLRPPLTTVSVPHHELGAEAAQMLLETINEPDRPPRNVLLPLSLVVRGSTAEAAG